MSKDELATAKPAFEPRPHSQAGTRFGASLELKGELTGHESVVVEGRLKGTVTLPSGTLTIVRGARVEADIKVKELVLSGDFEGNVTAGDRVQLTETAQMSGDITAARVSIASGARFKGKIKITKT
jgi:cytoskeletal protein CcmA (bactofilin family)